MRLRRKSDKIVTAMETMMYQIDGQEERSGILRFLGALGGPAGSEVFQGLPLPAAVDLITENLDALVNEWEARHHDALVNEWEAGLMEDHQDQE